VAKYSLTEKARELRKEPFEFEWDGRDWALPHIMDTDLASIPAADSGDIEAVRESVALAFRYSDDKSQAEAWRAALPVPAVALFELFRDWHEWSGTKPGESEASSPSSKSTGRPSKRTSRGSTTSGSPRRSRAKAETVELPANSSS
jgi:hypothetical protein